MYAYIYIVIYKEFIVYIFLICASVCSLIHWVIGSLRNKKQKLRHGIWRWAWAKMHPAMSSFHGVMAQWLAQCQNTICSGSSWCWKSLLTGWESTPNHWAASLFSPSTATLATHAAALAGSIFNPPKKICSQHLTALEELIHSEMWPFSSSKGPFLGFWQYLCWSTVTYCHFIRCHPSTFQQRDGNLKRVSTPYKMRLKKAHSHA